MSSEFYPLKGYPGNAFALLVVLSDNATEERKSAQTIGSLLVL
jgi:hypothetical protein